MSPRGGATRSVLPRLELLVHLGQGLDQLGAFGAVARRIHALDLRSSLIERIRSGRPTMAICLGLQIFAEASAESPGAVGLGVIPVAATSLPDGK